MMLQLFFDEDGEKLNVGDVVLVNSEFSTIIDEDGNGDRYLKGLPRDLFIESIVRVDDSDD